MWTQIALLCLSFLFEYYDLNKFRKYERYITPDGYRIVQKVTRDHMGFCLDRQTSLLKSGGIGVFVVQGEIKKHSLVAFYPGTQHTSILHNV